VSRQHGLLTMLVAVAIVGTGVAVVKVVHSYRPIDATTARPQELVRWIATRDFAAEPLEFRLAFVNRMETIPLETLCANEVRWQVSEQVQQRLRDNVDALQRTWMADRSAHYARCGRNDRKDYLRAQLDSVKQWSQWETALDCVSSETKPSVDLFTRINRWIDEADPAASEEMIAAVYHGFVLWLATEDVSDQPLELRRAAVNRIERELERGLELFELPLELSGAEEETLRANGILLTEVWFGDRADEYATLDEEQRQAFVDDQLRKIAEWEIIQYLANTDTNDPSQQIVAIAHVSNLVRKWVDKVPDDEKPGLERFCRDIQARLAEHLKLF
jgi:hypothetical protein